MPTVYIPRTGTEWSVVEQMFLKAGWATDLGTRFYQTLPDLVCFTGGEDVSPSLYDQEPGPRTFCDPERDEIEAALFNAFPTRPKVGICRGGQFLNVMSGGSMEQHIEGHRNCQHFVYDYLLRKEIPVNSDHHQLMWPNYSAEVVATIPDDPEETEVCYYSHTKSLCFQPHPEWGHTPTRNYFFELINRYFQLQA